MTSPYIVSHVIWPDKVGMAKRLSNGRAETGAVTCLYCSSVIAILVYITASSCIALFAILLRIVHYIYKILLRQLSEMMLYNDRHLIRRRGYRTSDGEMRFSAAARALSKAYLFPLPAASARIFWSDLSMSIIVAFSCSSYRWTILFVGQRRQIDRNTTSLAVGAIVAYVIWSDNVGMMQFALRLSPRPQEKDAVEGVLFLALNLHSIGSGANDILGYHRDA